MRKIREAQRLHYDAGIGRTGGFAQSEGIAVDGARVPRAREAPGADLAAAGVARRCGAAPAAVSDAEDELEATPAPAVEQGAPRAAPQGGDAGAAVGGVQGGSSRGDAVHLWTALLVQAMLN